MTEYPPMTSAEWDRVMSTLDALQSMDENANLPPLPEEQDKPELEWPPGVAGQLAQAIYYSSARPVRTVAIASALAILAGVCGKCWNTYTGAGLNLYIAVVARSGIGKEAISDAIPALIRASVKAGERDAPSFFTFNSMASGQGLIKYLGEAPYSCVLHVSGEFGHDIQFMAVDKSGHHATLRQQMTKLYSKSAPTSMTGGISYASLENNVSIEGSASYSVIGETTPGTFFEALNGKMMADGFLSRFVVIEYDGPRPPLNENRQPFPEVGVKWFSALVSQAAQQANREPLQVSSSPEARELLRAFDKHCDDHVNATEDESRRQMWNRAHLNALKVASLLAVADNYVAPTVTADQARWAISLVLRNIANMTGRLESGDVGDGDTARERKLVDVLRRYLLRPPAPSYKVPKGMRENGIVPLSYLVVRTSQHSAFYNHKLGQNWALRDTVRSLVEAGHLMDMKKDRLIESFNYHGQGYRILNLPDYGG
ncbi:MAG: DUF3987 domain-containing protein [Oceanicaulis sp.]